MSKKAVTVVEIVAVVIVMGALATICYPAFSNVVEDANSKACQANLAALQTSLDIYAVEHDSIPGTLGALPQETLNRAFVSLMKEKGAWKYRLAYAISNFSFTSKAYAATLYQTIHGDKIQCPKCPGCTHSYGLNTAIANMTRAQYDTFNGLTIAETNNINFSASSDIVLTRHKQISIQVVIVGPQPPQIYSIKKTGNAITRGRHIYVYPEGTNIIVNDLLNLKLK